MSGAVYNENDPAAAAWLRELIANNLIAPGDVDERSIKDVRADDYRRYDQVHCFAGIGLHSAALRKAGWDDARPVGSASCPCQGFSNAGKGLGFADPRHLWPDYLRLVDEAAEQGQPWASTLFIEQVASAGEWLDLVQSDLEDRGFAFGYADLPAAGFAQGAHIRQRFFGVADRHDPERWADLAGRHFGDWPQAGRIEGYGESGAGRAAGGLADMHRKRRDWIDPCLREETGGRFARSFPEDGRGSKSNGMDNPVCIRRTEDGCYAADDPQADGRRSKLVLRHAGAPRLPGADCDWLYCRDGNYRPVESGTFPLVDAYPNRVALLRGFGNGLDFETAVNFISAYMEAAEIKAVMSELT